MTSLVSSSVSSNDADDAAAGTGSLHPSTPMPSVPSNVVHEESMSSTTAVVFAIISLVLYWLFLRPTTPTTNTARQQGPQQQQQRPANVNGNRTRRIVGNNNNNNNALQQQQHRAAAAATNVGYLAGEERRMMRTTTTAGTVVSAKQPVFSEAAKEILEKCKSKPPHFKKSATAPSDDAILSHIRIGGTNVLIDGLVAFSYTEAASLSSLSATATTTISNIVVPDSGDGGATGGAVVAVVEDDTQIMARVLRQERAKILSRLFENVTTYATATASGGGGNSNNKTNIQQRPPPKGGTVVVGLPYNHILFNTGTTAVTSLETIVRVLYCLATYYTVMVMVQIPPSLSAAAESAATDATSNNSDDYNSAQRLQEDIVTKLRQYSSSNNKNNYHLSESILPSHRIMVCTSITGRVALVRQLASVELVIDYDPEIKLQLDRFGYKVALLLDETEWNQTFP